MFNFSNYYLTLFFTDLTVYITPLFSYLSYVTICYSIITDKVVAMASENSGQSLDVKSDEKPMSHAARGIILWIT